MFETHPNTRASERRLTALASLVVHVVVAAAALVVPLARTAALPPETWVSPHPVWTPPPIANPNPGPIEVVSAPHAVPDVPPPTPTIDRDSMVGPESIPQGIAAIVDARPRIGGAQSTGPSKTRTPGSIIGVIPRTGGTRGRFPPVPIPPPPPPPPAPPPTPERIRVSAGVIRGNLIETVRPDYPALARAARVTGTVTLEGVVTRNGTVEELVVVDGHPLLRDAAVDAVRQWTYEPFLLNGQPVEVVTLFSIVFRMD